MTKQERIWYVHKLLSKQRTGTVIEQRKQTVQEIVELWQEDVDSVWQLGVTIGKDIGAPICT